MSVFEETSLIDEAFKKYVFVPDEKGVGHMIVDRETLVADAHYAFLNCNVHPYFRNLLGAAPSMYEALSNNLVFLDQLRGLLEQISNLNPAIIAAIDAQNMGNETVLMLARDGVTQVREAMRDVPRLPT